ncbi:MAG: SagB/ThcOx family dehydrogenase [Bacteroidales bacterium]
MYGKKNVEESLAMLYHENSKFTTHTIRTEGEKIGRFNNPYVIERASQPFKSYPNSKSIELSVYEDFKPKATLYECLINRRSIRDYDKDYKISLNELTALLFNSYGVTYKSKIAGFNVDGHIGMRNVPSGGALYPLEIYVVIFNAHIPSGLYHYRADNNSLELLKEGTFTEELTKIIQAEPYVNMRSSSALIITTGIIERLLIKYGDRGYRFLMQESGFVGQTVSLLAESINLVSCMLGGYDDDKVNEFIGIDGVFETINNIITIGKAAKTTDTKALEI